MHSYISSTSLTKFTSLIGNRNRNAYFPLGHKSHKISETITLNITITFELVHLVISIIIQHHCIIPLTWMAYLSVLVTLYGWEGQDLKILCLHWHALRWSLEVDHQITQVVEVVPVPSAEVSLKLHDKKENKPGVLQERNKLENNKTIQLNLCKNILMNCKHN